MLGNVHAKLHIHANSCIMPFIYFTDCEHVLFCGPDHVAIYVIHFIKSLVIGIQIIVTKACALELHAKYAAQIIMKGHKVASSS